MHTMLTTITTFLNAPKDPFEMLRKERRGEQLSIHVIHVISNNFQVVCDSKELIF